MSWFHYRMIVCLSYWSISGVPPWFGRAKLPFGCEKGAENLGFWLVDCWSESGKRLESLCFESFWQKGFLVMRVLCSLDWILPRIQVKMDKLKSMPIKWLSPETLSQVRMIFLVFFICKNHELNIFSWVQDVKCKIVAGRLLHENRRLEFRCSVVGVVLSLPNRPLPGRE